MSKEVICDKCGKTSKDLQGYNKFVNIEAYKYRGLFDIDASAGCLLNIDLCMDCFTQTATVMLSKKLREKSKQVVKKEGK